MPFGGPTLLRNVHLSPDLRQFGIQRKNEQVAAAVNFSNDDRGAFLQDDLG